MQVIVTEKRDLVPALRKPVTHTLQVRQVSFWCCKYSSCFEMYFGDVLKKVFVNNDIH